MKFIIMLFCGMVFATVGCALLQPKPPQTPEQECANQNANSCYIVGSNYENQGILDQAQSYYEKSCLLGDQVGCNSENEVQMTINQQKQKADQEQQIEDLRAAVAQKYNLPMCDDSDLLKFDSLPSNPQSNCLYMMVYPVKVMQSIPNGILVMTFDNQTVFILKTKTQYADDTIIPQGTPVKYVGIRQYTSVIGATKTVYEYKKLDP